MSRAQAEAGRWHCGTDHSVEKSRYAVTLDTQKKIKRIRHFYKSFSRLKCLKIRAERGKKMLGVKFPQKLRAPSPAPPIKTQIKLYCNNKQHIHNG